MKICILTANLGSFDTLQEPEQQSVTCDYFSWDDSSFPPIAGLTPRLQYRIPKTHGWQMKPGYDVYLWLDGSLTLLLKESLKWLLDQLGDDDIAFFKHPARKTICEEVEHIKDKLDEDHWYITPRYKGGLHGEFLGRILTEGYKDDTLYASTAFIYRNTPKVREALKDWWCEGSRYFTCDQVQLPYILRKHKLKVKRIDEKIFDNPYLKVVSSHK